MKNYSTTLLLLLLSVGVFGQNAFDISTYQSAESIDLRSYEEAILDISADSTLRAGKGWKTTARWYDFAAKHLGSNGRAIDARAFSESIAQYEEMTKTPSNGLRANPWVPAGPFDAPSATQDYLVEGTGRINTITFHPTDPDVIWIGGGQGGLFKSVDRGANWIPFGDDLPVLRVSDIQINPANTDEMYICLGDYAYLAYWLETRDVKRNTHFGLGLYRSTDGGASWAPTGLTTELNEKDASLLRRSFISPDDEDVLLAAGIKGVFRSEDRGATWTSTLDYEMWDIEQDPNNENVLYASSGYIRNLDMGTCALWKSNDFGQTWNELPINIGEQAAQRLEISISPANPDVVYVIACDLSGGFFGFYRSQDGGDSWELRASQPNILHWSSGAYPGGQGTYDLAIAADPDDVDRVSIGGVNSWVTTDGGASWNGASYYTNAYGEAVHADHHMLKYSPHDGMLYLCHDGGVSRTQEIVPGSWDDAQTDPDYKWPTQWEHLNNGLANLAFYRLDVSQSLIRPNILAGAQDMGMFLKDVPGWTYHTLGDGMESVIDPLDPDVIYGSSQYGNVMKSTDRGQGFRPLGWGMDSWRDESSEWTTPYMLSPASNDYLFVSGANVWGSYDGGDTFTKLSEFNQFPISAMDISPADPSRIYVGKRVWYGLDQPGELWRMNSNQSWNNISAGTPVDSLYVTFIETDDENPEIAWATFAGFAEGEKVYETRDGGITWENISLNLPNLPANCIIQHHGADHNPIYVGMDRGVYYKNDLMDEWELYSEGLPNVIVQDFAIHEQSQQLYIATFGRGVWMNNLLDQISTSTTDNIAELADFKVFPNPTFGDITIDLDDAGTYNFEIINSMGRTVHSAITAFNSGPNTIDASIFPSAGAYYVRITRNGLSSVRPIVKLD